MRGGAWVLSAVALWGCDLRQAREARFAEHRVSQATADYEKAGADPLARCVNARLVALAHADAGRAADANAWRAREAIDCAAAKAAMGGATAE